MSRTLPIISQHCVAAWPLLYSESSHLRPDLLACRTFFLQLNYLTMNSRGGNSTAQRRLMTEYKQLTANGMTSVESM